MLEQFKNNGFLRNTVKILVLLALTILLSSLLASNAVNAGLTGKDIASHFMTSPLVVSGFALLAMVFSGEISIGQGWVETALFSAVVIACVVLIKIAVVYYCTLGTARDYQNDSKPFPLGWITRLFLKVLKIILFLLFFPFYRAIAGALDKLTATYVDEHGNELSSSDSFGISFNFSFTHLLLYAALLSVTVWPLSIALFVMLLLAIRYIVPYELISKAAFRTNLTGRSISAKSLLLDIAATLIYFVYIFSMSNDIAERHLFTRPGMGNVLPLYLLALLPLVLLIYVSTAIALSRREPSTRTSVSSPQFLKNNAGFLVFAGFMVILHLLAFYAGSKSDFEPIETVGVNSGGILSVIARVYWSCVLPPIEITRYGRTPGAPAFFRLLGLDGVFFLLVIVRVIFYVMIAVKAVKAVIFLFKKLLMKLHS